MEHVRGKNKRCKRLCKIVLFTLLLGGVVWMNMYAINNESVLTLVSTYSYGGILGVAVLSGFNLLVPIPIIGLYPVFLEAGLHSVGVIITISIGMTIGDMFGYAIGRTGRSVVHVSKDNQFMVRLAQLEKRHPMLPYVFLFVHAAIVPFPNEIVVIPAAFIGCKFRYVIIATLLGNTIFTTASALGFIHVFSLL
jgi:membrane protein YqaA with SNARE-associated domain